MRTLANQIGRHFFWRNAVVKFTAPWWSLRAKTMKYCLTPYLGDAKTVLDIGAGSGLLGEAFAKETGASVVLLDVMDWNLSSLPLQLYNGKDIPFPDRSFDAVLLIDVLHHIAQDAAVLGEALRVGKRVIVVEWLHRPGFFFHITKFVERFQEFFYGMSPCYHERSKAEWLQFFRQFHVTIEELGRFSYWQYGFELSRKDL